MKDKEEFISILIIIVMVFTIFNSTVGLITVMEDRMVLRAIVLCDFEQSCLPIVVDLMEQFNYPNSSIESRRNVYDAYKKVIEITGWYSKINQTEE